MIRIPVPSSAPRGADLKVIISVGRQGFTRTETIKNKRWKALGAVYVDPDATKVEFKAVGKDWADHVNVTVF
jgi:hypothetical protein